MGIAPFFFFCQNFFNFSFEFLRKILVFKFCGNKLGLIAVVVAVHAIIEKTVQINLNNELWSMTTQKSMKLNGGVSLSMKIGGNKIRSVHMLYLLSVCAPILIASWRVTCEKHWIGLWHSECVRHTVRNNATFYGRAIIILYNHYNQNDMWIRRKKVFFCGQCKYHDVLMQKKRWSAMSKTTEISSNWLVIKWVSYAGTGQDE